MRKHSAPGRGVVCVSPVSCVCGMLLKAKLASCLPHAARLLPPVGYSTLWYDSKIFHYAIVHLCHGRTVDKPTNYSFLYAQRSTSAKACEALSPTVFHPHGCSRHTASRFSPKRGHG